MRELEEVKRRAVRMLFRLEKLSSVDRLKWLDGCSGTPVAFLDDLLE